MNFGVVSGAGSEILRVTIGNHVQRHEILGDGHVRYESSRLQEDEEEWFHALFVGGHSHASVTKRISVPLSNDLNYLFGKGKGKKEHVDVGCGVVSVIFSTLQLIVDMGTKVLVVDACNTTMLLMAERFCGVTSLAFLMVFSCSLAFCSGVYL